MSIESRLADARRDLDAHISRIEAEARANGSASISFGKRIGDGTSVAVERLNEIAILERLTKQRRMIIRAQAKLADGTYGACDGCGSAIDDARLDALVWAIHCLECADLEVVPPTDQQGAEPPAEGPASATSDSGSPWDGVRWSE